MKRDFDLKSMRPPLLTEDMRDVLKLYANEKILIESKPLPKDQRPSAYSTVYVGGTSGTGKIEASVRVAPSDLDPASQWIYLLKSLDKMLQGAVKNLGGLTAPVVFQNLPPAAKVLLESGRPLWDDKMTPEFLAQVVAPRTFYIDSPKMFRAACGTMTAAMGDMADGLDIPPFVTPWDTFRVRFENDDEDPWIELNWDDDDPLEFIRTQAKRIGFTVHLQNPERNQYVVFDDLLARWSVWHKDKRVSEWSKPNPFTRFTAYDGNTHSYYNIATSKDGTYDPITKSEKAAAGSEVAPIVMLQAFVAMINHRRLKREPMEDPDRPMNRQQRRATGYVDRECERVILGPRAATVARYVMDGLAGKNQVERRPHWVRRFPRRKPSGGWTWVRPHQRAVKGLTAEQKAAIKPKDYDASSLTYHTAHDDVT